MQKTLNSNLTRDPVRAAYCLYHNFPIYFYLINILIAIITIETTDT